jgi:hypothetical protein
MKNDKKEAMRIKLPISKKVNGMVAYKSYS